MPNSAQFLAGFDLVPGHVFDGYTLKTATANEQTVSRYHEYSYDIVLTFDKSSPAASQANLALALNVLTRETRSIKAIRNYYNCSIEAPKNSDFSPDGKGGFIVKLKGHATR